MVLGKGAYKQASSCLPALAPPVLLEAVLAPLLTACWPSKGSPFNAVLVSEDRTPHLS